MCDIGYSSRLLCICQMVYEEREDVSNVLLSVTKLIDEDPETLNFVDPVHGDSALDLGESRWWYLAKIQ